MAEIERLLEHDTAGDPMTGLRWMRKTTAKVAAQLSKLGIQVSARTVARLLRELKFSLRVNQKKLGLRHPARDRQFRYISKQRQCFRRQGNPIISVDAKKRELVANFKNPGTKWDRVPTPVNDHDFRSPAEGVAILYGIYDPQANRGAMFVGVSHETSAFAATSIRSWWAREGRQRYPRAQHLLILADTGGSNSANRGAWKDQLQQLCDRFGLIVTVAHYPTGASKFNPIERRLFSQISKNWAGEPLGSYEKILKFIRTTKTSTGLKVRACLDRKDYPLGVKPSPARLRELRITRPKFAPKWNYTIKPSTVK
jgi:Rhodopirellula transposase DDE domain